jgi:hypothetical protein
VEKLALEHIHSGNVTTHLVINMLLSNQKVSISANKLKELLKVKGIEFDLPITKDNPPHLSFWFFCLPEPPSTSRGVRKKIKRQTTTKKLFLGGRVEVWAYEGGTRVPPSG